MNNKRTNLIYGNCKVFSPDGHLMFRCLEKRANWYLSRNLAIILEDNPLSIQLNFTPKGNGESVESLKGERHNRCVVCGNEDLDKLTKHHLVPFSYRQFFPDERKRHSSLFVVPICKDCHINYESNYADILKKDLAIIYNAPFNKIIDGTMQKIINIINCLLQPKNKIPANRIIMLKDNLYQHLKSINKDENFEPSDIAYLNFIKDELKLMMKMNKNDSHGKIVVNQLNDIKSFENMWGNHFIKSMNPKYMPDYINIIV